MSLETGKIKKVASIFVPIAIMFIAVISILYFDKISEIPLVFIFNLILLFIFLFFYVNFVLGKNIFKKDDDINNLEQAIIQEKLETNPTESIVSSYEDFILELKKTKKANELNDKTLSILSKYIEIIIGVIYEKSNNNTFAHIARYAFPENEEPQGFKNADGFCGQATTDKKVLIIKEIPEDYTSSFSGMGSGSPSNIVFIPLIYKNKVEGLIEIALFKIKDNYMEFFNKISENFLNDIKIAK